MTNILARQRLEIFAPTYEKFNVYPANNLLADGEIIVPDRKHFVATQLQVIEKLIKSGILAQEQLRIKSSRIYAAGFVELTSM